MILNVIRKSLVTIRLGNDFIHTWHFFVQIAVHIKEYFIRTFAKKVDTYLHNYERNILC